MNIDQDRNPRRSITTESSMKSNQPHLPLNSPYPGRSVPVACRERSVNARKEYANNNHGGTGAQARRPGRSSKAYGSFKLKGKQMQAMSLMFATLLALGAVSNSVLAGGLHAGGHGHEDDAIGVPGDAARVTRTIEISMTDDMRFTPSRIGVKRGETIRFMVINAGRVKHELVLGSKKDLEEHYKVMIKHPEMEHAEENMVTLASAETGEIVWQFTKAGKVDFACLQPGHYDAGMKGQVIVTAKKPPKEK